MSIQEIWYLSETRKGCRKVSGRGGLGYRYPAGGYGIIGQGAKDRLYSTSDKRDKAGLQNMSLQELEDLYKNIPSVGNKYNINDRTLDRDVIQQYINKFKIPEEEEQEQPLEEETDNVIIGMNREESESEEEEEEQDDKPIIEEINNIDIDQLLDEISKLKHIKETKPLTKEEEEKIDHDIDYLNNIFLKIKNDVTNDKTIIPEKWNTEVGNRVENYLDKNTELFKTLFNDVEGEVHNSSNAFVYYTDDALEEAKEADEDRINNQIPILEKNKQGFENERKKAILSGNTNDVMKYQALVNQTQEQIDKIKKPTFDFYLVDYISKNNLFEIKSLSKSFADYKTRTWVSSSFTNPKTKVTIENNVIGPDGKKTSVTGGINFVANKITGETGGFKPIFKRDSNGKAYIEQIYYQDVKNKKKLTPTLKNSYSNYDVIFFLQDGIYKYNVLDDPNLIISESGKAKLNYPKNEGDYIIPTDRLVKISAIDLLKHNIPKFTSETIVKHDISKMIPIPKLEKVDNIVSKAKNTKK